MCLNFKFNQMLSLNDFSISGDLNLCEYICIDAQLNATKYRFIVIYSPPHSCFKNQGGPC